MYGWLLGAITWLGLNFNLSAHNKDDTLKITGMSVGKGKHTQKQKLQSRFE